MFTVRGAVYGDPYEVTWDDGLLTGTAEVVSLLHDTVGQQVTVPPVGPVYDLDLSDDKAVLAALLDLTTVQDTEGDAPTVVPAEEAGVVY